MSGQAVAFPPVNDETDPISRGLESGRSSPAVFLLVRGRFSLACRVRLTKKTLRSRVSDGLTTIGAERRSIGEYRISSLVIRPSLSEPLTAGHTRNLSTWGWGASMTGGFPLVAATSGDGRCRLSTRVSYIQYSPGQWSSLHS